MRYLFFTLVILFSLIVACGDDVEPVIQPPVIEYGSLTGKAFLAGTAVTIPGVVVTVDDMVDTTGDDGLFSIDSIPEGMYTIQAAREDYALYEADIEISGSTAASVAMRLSISDAVVTGTVSHPYYGVVGATKVQIGEMSDVTDQNGRFEIDNAPVGEQVLTCTDAGPGYHDVMDTVYVLSSEQEIDITLTRTITSGIQLNDDATVKLSSIEPELSEENYGFVGELDLYFLNDEQHQTERFRVFISLPSIPGFITIDQIESARLVLSRSSSRAAEVAYNPKTVRAIRVVESWSEGTITFANLPETADTILVTGSVRDRFTTEFDLLDYYRDSTGIENGLMLILDSDYRSEYTGSPSGERIKFFSREVAEPSVRPRVEFRYTH